MTPSVSDEIRYRLLRYLEQHPDASQRELARHLGVSVGKINYCVRALIGKGLVKMRNFRGSTKKIAYVYVITPKGMQEKISVTSRFLKRKLVEYDSISAEIQRLTRELAESDVASSDTVSTS
jgi:EPS-associated MarR family transcriptional regulator